MTVDQDVRDAPGGDDTLEATSRPRSAAVRFGVLAVLALVVFVAATWSGQMIRNHHYATMRPVVIAQCAAVQVAQLTGKAGGDFNRLNLGPTTTTRRPDGSWTVLETATLSGHVENGVADGDTVQVRKTCTLSGTAAGRQGARPDVVLIQFNGPRTVSDQRFTLDGTGTYVGGGAGLEISQ